MKTVFQPQRAFTLVEILVAASITLLLAALIAGVMVNVIRGWDRAESDLATERQARAALDRLEQDLQGALCRDDGNVWLAATVQAAASSSGLWVAGSKPIAESLAPATPELIDARFGVAGTWLRFITVAHLATSDPAAPAAVSYQIIRRSPLSVNSPPHYLLYRAEVPAAPTLAAGYDLAANIYTTGDDASGTPGNLVRPPPLQILADNVIDFGVRFYSFSSGVSSGPPVLEQIFPASPSDLEHLSRGMTGDAQSRYPASVDVLLRILTDEGVRQIAALEAGNLRGDWWRIATAHSRVFTRRVLIPARAP